MDLLLELFFPKRCVGCREFGVYFCKECISNIKQWELICPQCKELSDGGKVHVECKSSYSLDGLWSLGAYQNPLRAAITQLKYKWVRELANSLVDIVIKYWTKYQPFILDEIKANKDNWVIVPVPLHLYRQKWRGFNQSALLAKDLSKKLSVNYADCLRRIRSTEPQVTLKGEQRQQNIKNAFIFNSQFSIVNCQILLVDDVWTTGSTMKECCIVLKKAGAKQVWAITLAR